MKVQNNSEINESNNNKMIEKVRDEAIESILKCRNYAVGAGLLGLASFLYTNYSTLLSLSPLQLADLGAKFHQIVFGVSLHRTFCFVRDATKGGERLKSSAIVNVGKIVSRRWAFTASIRTVQALIVAESTGAVWFEIFSIVLLVANIPICYLYHQHSINNKQQYQNLPIQPGYTQARKDSLNIGLNLLYCVVPILISGLTELITNGMIALSSPDERPVLRAWTLVNGFLDSAELITVSYLLFSLYEPSLRTAMEITKNLIDPKEKTSMDIDLFNVQKELFSKLGEFFETQIIFTILPFVLPAGVALLSVYSTLDGVRDYLSLLRKFFF